GDPLALFDDQPERPDETGLLDEAVVLGSGELGVAVEEVEGRVAGDREVPADELQSRVRRAAAAAAGAAAHGDRRLRRVDRAADVDRAAAVQREGRLRVA